MVDAGYIAALRISIQRGREFTERDDAGAPRVVMVNETLARRYWPGQDALGRHIVVGRLPSPFEVVGVVGDVRNISISADVQPEFYIPWKQLPWAMVRLVVRAAGDPRAVAGAVRARVFAIDKDQPVTNVRTMEEVLAEGAVQPRFTTFLLGGLSATALLLAMVGIYGIIAFTVTERTQEMGIRIALGTGRGDILRLVLRQALLTSVAGVSVGLIAAFALTRLMSALLYRVSVTDPLTFVAAPLLFISIAVLAGYFPALCATRVNPVVALR
jgi:putative ABC transport system permease protein